MTNLNIERNYHNGGLSCFFYIDGQEYFADLCQIQFADYTECMIFATKDRQLTVSTAKELYCKRNIDVTSENLTKCVNEFIKRLKK